MVVTDRVPGAVLEQAQQLGLLVQGQVADLVQEEGATGGGGDLALRTTRIRPGEGPGRIAEQLGFEEARRDGGAVQGDEGRVALLAAVMDAACEQLLAGAGLAFDQAGEVGCCMDAIGERKQAFEIAAGYDHPVCDLAGRMPGGGVADEIDALDQPVQFAHVDRLAQVVDRSAAHGLDRRARVAEGGHQRDGRGVRLGTQSREQGQSVHAGHAQVADHQAWPLLADRGQGLGAAAGVSAVVADLSEELGQAQADIGMVVDKQDAHGHRYTWIAVFWNTRLLRITSPR